jgi:transcription elongation GreA/GreB family factor
LKYLNNGSFLSVQIVASPADPTTSLADTIEISPRSPLAMSILGHAPGQVVKVGDLDHYVEIVEVKG